MTEERRPKDMTQEELDALPVCGPGGARYEEFIDPETGLKRRKPIKEPGRCVAVEPDDIAVFEGSDGRLYMPRMTAAGWHKEPWF